jgi:DNA-binding transcriptional LysR family regulator
MGIFHSMSNWEDLRHFEALARLGTLSTAARVLGVEHATVARRVARLEADSGMKLIDRRGRRLRLTADGERYAAIVARMQAETFALERAKVRAQSIASALVTISAPPTLAAARLTPALSALRRRHPQLSVTLLGEKREASLDRREADIAVRLTRPRKGNLTIVRSGAVRFRLYASRDYLAFIAYDETMDDAPQQSRLREIAAGRPICFRASTIELQKALVKDGAGVAMLPDFVATMDEDLVDAMPKMPRLLREIWLVVHSDMKTAPFIRIVLRELQRALKEQLPS